MEAMSFFAIFYAHPLAASLNISLYSNSLIGKSPMRADETFPGDLNCSFSVQMMVPNLPRYSCFGPDDAWLEMVPNDRSMAPLRDGRQGRIKRAFRPVPIDLVHARVYDRHPILPLKKCTRILTVRRKDKFIGIKRENPVGGKVRDQAIINFNLKIVIEQSARKFHRPDFDI
jgi:hypothetical protein